MKAHHKWGCILGGRCELSKTYSFKTSAEPPRSDLGSHEWNGSLVGDHLVVPSVGQTMNG